MLLHLLNSYLTHYYYLISLTVSTLGLLPENSKYIIWFSNISIWSLPDEGYSRNCRAVSGSALPWLFKCKMYLLSKLSPPLRHRLP